MDSVLPNTETIRTIKEYLAGLLGIPMLFDGNSLCPECLWKAMDIYGSTYFCKHCDSRFPATINIDKYGRRWLELNDVKTIP